MNNLISCCQTLIYSLATILAMPPVIVGLALYVGQRFCFGDTLTSGAHAHTRAHTHYSVRRSSSAISGKTLLIFSRASRRTFFLSLFFSFLISFLSTIKLLICSLNVLYISKYRQRLPYPERLNPKV